MEKEQRNIEETLEQKKKQLPGIFMQDIQIRNLIYVIRGRQVMMDSDLADLYQVETKVFNQAVKRNIARFPEAFRFQLTYEEYTCLRSQIVTSNGSADASIVLIDNYIDVDTLNILSKKKLNVVVFIYTMRRTKLTEKDVANFNKQYPTLKVRYTEAFHDRFLILDKTRSYHIGASLKDAGKRCFAVSRLEDVGMTKDILRRLEQGKNC